MELSIKPAHKNEHALSAILVRSASAAVWLSEIGSMGFTLNEVDVYPVPGTTANTLWGCLVLFYKNKSEVNIGRHVFCQFVRQKLVIPAYAELYPQLSADEVQMLFGEKIWLMHPETGLVEFEEKVNWKSLLELPQEKASTITIPADGIFIPTTINSFEVAQVPPETVLANMEEKIFPKQETLKDKPLNTAEKIRLQTLRRLFKKHKVNEKTGEAARVEKSDLLKRIEALFGIKSDNKTVGRLQQNFEDLEFRNQQEIDKLLDLFKTNPEEALKYAIPIDNEGTSRGGETSHYQMTKMRDSFSLWSGGRNSGSGGVSLEDDLLTRLNRQYNQTAEELIKKGDYEKAAFIYLKLLKDPTRAAGTLEQGNLYAEAASIYIKHLNNKNKAAECYEKGNMTQQAIELYKELNMHEKVGDLYMKINQRPHALVHYKKVIDDYRSKNQFIKASLIYRNKIGDTQAAQEMLLEGWWTRQDAFNCLDNYFANIGNEPALKIEVIKIYSQEKSPAHLPIFLKAIAIQHKKHESLRETTREIAYEIISALIETQPAIIAELKSFNTDHKLPGDIVKFRTHKLR